MLDAQQWLERSLGGVKAVILVKIHAEPVSGDKDPIIVTRQKGIDSDESTVSLFRRKKKPLQSRVDPFLRC